MGRLYPEFLGGPRAVALLFLRLVAGTAFVLHGWPKIQHADVLDAPRGARSPAGSSSWRRSRSSAAGSPGSSGP